MTTPAPSWDESPAAPLRLPNLPVRTAVADRFLDYLAQQQAVRLRDLPRERSRR